MIIDFMNLSGCEVKEISNEVYKRYDHLSYRDLVTPFVILDHKKKTKSNNSQLATKYHLTNKQVRDIIDAYKEKFVRVRKHPII